MMAQRRSAASARSRTERRSTSTRAYLVLLMGAVAEACAMGDGAVADRPNTLMDAVQQGRGDSGLSADAASDTPAMEGARRADADPFFDGQALTRDV